MDHQTTSIEIDEAVAASDEARTASSELTEITAESLEWVAGGPGGSIAVIS